MKTIKIEEIDLYVTERCNLKCDFCSIEANTRECKELSKDKIFEIIEAAMQYGLEQLHLTGGEPTLRTDLEDIIEFGINKNLNVRLITNGTVLTTQRLGRLYAKGLRSIMVSLDGLEEYHNKVRGENNYKKVMELIKYAITLPDMIVRANSVAWRDNIDDIFELTKRLDNMGVNIYSIFLGSPLGFGKRWKYNVLDADTYRKFTLLEEEIVCNNNIKMLVVMEKGFLFDNEERFDRDQMKGRGIGCYKINEGSDYFLIRGDGDVYPCVFFANEGEKIGNVMKTDFNQIVETFYKSEFYWCVGDIPQECALCADVDVCKGGCKGYAKIYNNNWNSRDSRCSGLNHKYIPLCPIMKKNINSGMIGGSSEQVVKCLPDNRRFS